MAISHVGSGTATASSGTTLQLSKPSGTAEGDLLVAIFYIEAASPPTITPPTGWASRGTATGTATRAQVFTKIAGPSEPSNYVFTSSLTISTGSGALNSYSAAGEALIGDYLFDATAKTPGVAPSVTTTRDNSLLFVAFMTVTLGTGVAGMTPRVALDNGSRDLATFDQTIASPGSSGTRTYTDSGSSWSFSLAIEEPPFVTETFTPTLGESLELGVPLPTNDSPTPTLTEASSLSITLSRGETLLPSLSDLLSQENPLLVRVSDADLLTPFLFGSTGFFNTGQWTDKPIGSDEVWTDKKQVPET